MEILFEHELADGLTARVACTNKSDGDLSMSAVDSQILASRRSDLVGFPWTACRQVHSDRIISPSNDATVAPVADAVMTTIAEQVVAVHSADCVPVGFVHGQGAVAAAHAGWRGLERGVLESTVRALRTNGDAQIVAVVGPHVRTASYEFGEAPLRRLARRFGPSVVGQTSTGTPALNLAQAITNELERLHVPIAVQSSDCTALQAEQYWSYRARAEQGRFALVAWMSHA